jgi:beta-alanine--pyruvate transaminase
MPFTANKAFKETRVPKTVVRGKGMYFYDADNRAIMDTMGGLWCSAAGISPDPVGSIAMRMSSAIHNAA